MLDKLPFKEDVILEFTQSEEIRWEVKTQYIYEMGTTEPAGKQTNSATTRLRSFLLDYDGTNLIYFRYHSLNLGYILISPELQKAIEENGERLVCDLNKDLERILQPEE
jgi:hypothetical protein